MHDKKNKSIIPFAEFLTTSHLQENVTKYLNSIKNKLEDTSCQNIFPKIIVTDMSWTLINSILRVFNNFTLNEYLNWCFNYIFKDKHKKKK